jgi:ribonuclease HI
MTALEKNTGESVKVFTDGSCLGNPGPGGWGAVLIYRGKRRELSGGEPLTTNNRMELTAAVRALNCLTRPCLVELTTDSQYVRLGITEWIVKWKRRKWQRKGGVVKNADLWRELDAATARHRVVWKWIKGHSGHSENEAADALAVAAAKAQPTSLEAVKKSHDSQVKAISGMALQKAFSGLENPSPILRYGLQKKESEEQ